MGSLFYGMSVEQKHALVDLAKGSLLIDCVREASWSQDVSVLRRVLETGGFDYAASDNEKIITDRFSTRTKPQRWRHSPALSPDPKGTTTTLSIVRCRCSSRPRS